MLCVELGASCIQHACRGVLAVAGCFSSQQASDQCPTAVVSAPAACLQSSVRMCSDGSGSGTSNTCVT